MRLIPAFSAALHGLLAARTASGLIGVQVHGGPPMKIESRKVLLKPRPTLAAEKP